jgi:hypothetical protein
MYVRRRARQPHVCTDRLQFSETALIGYARLLLRSLQQQCDVWQLVILQELTVAAAADSMSALSQLLIHDEFCSAFDICSHAHIWLVATTLPTTCTNSIRHDVCETAARTYALLCALGMPITHTSRLSLDIAGDVWLNVHLLIVSQLVGDNTMFMDQLVNIIDVQATPNPSLLLAAAGMHLHCKLVCQHCCSSGACAALLRLRPDYMTHEQRTVLCARLTAVALSTKADISGHAREECVRAMGYASVDETHFVSITTDLMNIAEVAREAVVAHALPLATAEAMIDCCFGAHTVGRRNERTTSPSQHLVSACAHAHNSYACHRRTFPILSTKQSVGDCRRSSMYAFQRAPTTPIAMYAMQRSHGCTCWRDALAAARLQLYCATAMRNVCRRRVRAD